MQDRSSWLSATALTTVYLLGIGGSLLVLGAFDSNLGWDIFSPSVEAFLTALFLSCLAVAAIGVAVCFVIAAHEIVRNVRLIQFSLVGGCERAVDLISEKTGKSYRWVGGLLSAISLLVFILAIVNQRVQIHRHTIFRKLAADQYETFAPRIATEVSKLSMPPRNAVPAPIHEFISSLDSLAFVRTTTLYLPDPEDVHAMWGYTAWREWKVEDGFARFYITKPFEKAMVKAISGDLSLLESLNEQSTFEWYGVVKNKAGKPIGILRIDGETTENFREY